MRRPRKFSPTTATSADATPDTAPRPVREKTPDEQRAALMEYALRALSQRSLSAAELRGKLAKRSEDEDQIEQVLGRLTELRYLDDAQVARAENQRRGVGAYRVRQRLKQRGVDEALIQDTLQARDPDEEAAQALNLLTRRLSNLQRASNPRARAYGLLARRGYGSDVIRRALDALDWSAGAGEDETWPGNGGPGDDE